MAFIEDGTDQRDAPKAIEDRALRELSIVTHPGIGDFSWIYSKLVHSPYPLRIRIAEDAKTERALPYVKLLKNIEHVEYGEKQDYFVLKDAWNAYFGDFLDAAERGEDLYISANNWLEEGNRLEEFMPDLPTEFHYEIRTTEDDEFIAERYLPEGSVYFGIYTSSQGGVNSWNAWSRFEWMDFVKRVRNEYPHVVFVLVGAKWDMDLTDRFSGDLRREGIEHINLCGKTPMGVCVEVLKRLAYFAGFASGMGILSNVLNRPQLMLYPDHLEKLMTSWPCPVSLGFGSHQYSLWARPSRVFHQIKPGLDAYVVPR